ncbi:hypothetical protein B0T17DRAFT_487134 [Bombardia bombarda]|uniref:Uncharacterized protein n=1 Tax=Bombardia bombarda TaxID=252184 RepID=A0AA39XBZ8_9PEZI|nr:hypothetical protein B0T17DRAFT_487134 [Bombardia bombarda]
MSPPPNHASQLSYSGTGQLLAGACTSTSYTLIDGGDTVYYAAFIGCDRSRPECCPWSVSNVAADIIGAGQFPVPANNGQAVLRGCPDDYYAVSGLCCPK